jgi:predicted RNA-binding Zn-ribbon protein involved in translation (DUF1610 family)
MWLLLRGKRHTAEPIELKPIEPMCSQCGYDLRAQTNLTGARCPECGSQLRFDELKFKRDRKEQERYQHLRPIRHWLPIQWSRRDAIVVGLVMGITAYVIVVTFPRSIGSRLLLTFVLIAELACAHYVIAKLRKWQLRRYEEERRRAKDR